MSIEDNKTVARKWIDAVNKKDYAAFDELMTPELAASTKKGIARAYEIWPNHHVEIVDMVAEGDQVWMKSTNSADQGEEVEGIPPTGKHWSTDVIFCFRFVNGRLASTDGGVADTWSIYKQLGATLAPPKG